MASFGLMRLFPVSIVIVQKTLVHVLSAMCEQSERERANGRETQRQESETDRQRNRELCFHLFDSLTTSL